MGTTSKTRTGARTLQTLGTAGMVSVSLSLAVLGCSKSTKKPEAPTQHDTKARTFDGGLTIPAGSLPKIDPATQTLRLPGGDLVPVRLVNGRQYVQVHGTLSGAGFQRLAAGAAHLPASERTAALAHGLARTLKQMSEVTPVLDADVVPEIGYFSAWVAYDSYGALRTVRGVPEGLLLNPVVSAPFDPSTARRMSDEHAEGLTPADGRLSNAAHSGLERIGAPQFVKTAQAEIGGASVDGSKVKVGVTDTGVTYNHPAFRDADGNNRIVYMKDFTGEGRAYFSDAARFEVTVPAARDVPAGADPKAVLLLTADFLAPAAPGTQPVADVFARIKKQPILVSPELRRLLTSAGNGARLSLISEKAFASDAEKADINQNGSTEDALWAILVPGRTPAQDRIFLDLTGTGDFRASVGLGDFNATKQTVAAYSEAFGFELKPGALLNAKGEPVPLRTASIVGFDPGNHGSHVSGIIAARKTIANDADATLARGVAPNAQLMVNRVCANNGGCNATRAIIDLAQNGAEVINMSLGGLSPFNDGYGVEETVVNRLTMLYNTLFIISAGNSGPGRNTVGSPSSARLSLSVGASASRGLIERQYQWPGSGKPAEVENNDEEFMLFFSSRGPTAAGGFKPNLAAPGTELSTIQLNAAPGAHPGLDVYWGTSMAAPTAAGAAALLIDAAKKYNAAHPDKALPLDSRTVRDVLIASARPFDASTYNPQTGKKTKGQYTWIDQGNGLINLPRAWSALKAARDARLPSSVVALKVPGDTQSPKVGIKLDYGVRIQRINPNGIAYDGTTPYFDFPGIDIDTQQPLVRGRFATGIWLDHAAKDSLVEVSIARRLPEDALQRSDVGELARQLATTSDSFTLETVFYGAQKEWLKAGTLNALDCATSGAPVPKFDVIGVGAVDAEPTVDATGAVTPPANIGLRAGNLYVCADRAAMATLKPGDHGAIIRAYRTVDGKREAQPAFEIPVYVTVPHQTLAGAQKYEITRTVKSFGVDRNYVEIPKGTSVVRVRLEVPEAQLKDGAVVGCAGAELMALEGINVAAPGEISPRPKAIASNCKLDGDFIEPEKRVVTYDRLNPTPGIWDLHVFGRYQFAQSTYTLSVEYAKVVASISEIRGGPETIQGSFEAVVLDASRPVAPSTRDSQYRLSGLVQETRPEIKQDEKARVPNRAGAVARGYGAEVSEVTFATGGLPGNDLDLDVLACEDAAATQCVPVGQSAGATDVESFTFNPEPGKFYVGVVTGFTVQAGTAQYAFTETLSHKEADAGTLKVGAGADASRFLVSYGITSAQSKLLRSEAFKSGAYDVTGTIELRSADQWLFLKVPVRVSAEETRSPAATPAPAPGTAVTPAPTVSPTPAVVRR